MIVPAQWLIIEGWAVVVPAFIGWGVLVRWLWREPLRADAGDLLLTFWLGWAAVLLALQLWHFALPVDGRAQLFVGVVGVCGLVGALRPTWRIIRRFYRGLPVIALGVPAAAWLSNRALEGARFGDSGGYYVPTIRWMIEHRLVVGLSNLYPPYGYNQTYFLYAALLDGSRFAGRPEHLLNSTLIAVLVARSLLALWRLVGWRTRLAPSDVFYTLMLPAEAEAAMGFLFTSPAPDFGVYALGIALCGEFVAVLTDRGPDQRLHFLALALLSAVAPTIKLPILGLAAASMAIAAVTWIRRARPMRRAIADIGVALGMGAFALGPWTIANILMSGCPFFPSAIAALPVSWRVNWDVEAWIQNTMIMGDWHILLREPRWVAQRFVALGWTESAVAVPLAIALATAVFTALAAPIRLLRRPRRVGPRLAAAALLPPLASLIFCIETTPVPRYAGATMWLLAACSAMVALGSRLLAPLARRVTAVVAVALVALPFASGAPRWLNYRDFQISARPAVAVQRLPSGLEVNVPIGVAACWDAPLPCTPSPHPGLRLRDPPNLSSGFEVEPGSKPPGPVTVPGLRSSG